MDSDTCHDGNRGTAHCWITTAIQLFSAVALFSYPTAGMLLIKAKDWISRKRSSLLRENRGAVSVVDDISGKKESLKRFQMSAHFQGDADEPEESPSKGEKRAVRFRSVNSEEVERSPPGSGKFSPVFSSDSDSSTLRFTEDFLSNDDEEGKEKKNDKIEGILLSTCYVTPMNENSARYTIEDSIVDHGSNSPVFETQRSEENFLKQNDDETIQYPSDYQPEYVTLYQDDSVVTPARVLRSIYSLEDTKNMLRTSVGFSFLAGGITSLSFILFSFDRYRAEVCNTGYDSEKRKNMIIKNADAIFDTIDSFKFLPIFLLLAAFGFLVDRWRRFMVRDFGVYVLGGARFDNCFAHYINLPLH